MRQVRLYGKERREIGREEKFGNQINQHSKAGGTVKWNDPHHDEAHRSSIKRNICSRLKSEISVSP